MLYIFAGQSCTGKSTVAEKMKGHIDAEIFAGKDYLKMAKSESEAWRLFYDRLVNAANKQESIIYVITEAEQLAKVKMIEGARVIKFAASLDVVKSRFAQRMKGNLPQPVEKMLEKQYQQWENQDADIVIDTSKDTNIDDIVSMIIKM
jgi:predicted kinase